MPQKLSRHFLLVGIGIYLLLMLTVSVWFKPYALKPLWMVWGIGTVLFYFLLTYWFHNRWKGNDGKTFLRKIFWIALTVRVLYVVAIIFYYYWQTGVSFEYQAADSWNYHRTANYFAKLARGGDWREIFHILNSNTMGFSDQGYILYLTTLYTCFDNNILVPRLLKALMSAYMCVSIYKLASRNLGEKTGRLAAVMAVFMPQFIHYNGTYLKETELVFLTILALERFDFLIRSKRYTFWNIFFPILLTALTFGFRTIVGMLLIFCFGVFVLSVEKELFSKKAKIITIGVIIAVALVFFITPIGREMYIVMVVNFHTEDALIAKYQDLGLKYAEYANGKYMVPGFLTLPLTNLVEVANENQKMMNGTFFIKNYLAFFALWCIVVAIREKHWRNFSLIGSYTIIYALLIVFSFAFNSERYHLPVMPGLIIMAAYAMNRFRKKDFVFYYGYCILLVIAIVTWNYIKLAGRGLIF